MRLVEFLVCDDIRFEQHSKVSLVGVYNDSINIETNDPKSIPWPIGLRFGFYARVHLEEGEEWPKAEIPMELIVHFTDQSIAKIEGNVRVNDPKVPFFSIPVVVPQVAIPAPGTLSFELKLDLPSGSVALKPDFQIPVRIRPKKANV